MHIQVSSKPAFKTCAGLDMANWSGTYFKHSAASHSYPKAEILICL